MSTPKPLGDNTQGCWQKLSPWLHKQFTE